MRKHQWMVGLQVLGFGMIALVSNASAQRSDIPGPIDSLADLQDSGRIVFKLVDANNDGQISQKEAVDAGHLAVGGLFFRADANGDGSVSKEEVKMARESILADKPLLRFVIERVNASAKNKSTTNPNPAAVFMGLVDANSDGSLQASEVRQAVQTAVQGAYAAADTNRDGLMSPTEVNAAIVGAVKAAQLATFQAADTDNDGQVSKEEFTKSLTDPANAAFAVIDANADGKLSPQELQKAGQIIERQMKMMVVPEPANSARNLLNSGMKPEQVAPVPVIQVPQSATTPR